MKFKGMTLLEILVVGIIFSFVFIGSVSFIRLSGRLDKEIYGQSEIQLVYNYIKTEIGNTIRNSDEVNYVSKNRLEVLSNGFVTSTYTINNNSIYKNGNKLVKFSKAKLIPTSENFKCSSSSLAKVSLFINIEQNGKVIYSSNDTDTLTFSANCRNRR